MVKKALLVNLVLLLLVGAIADCHAFSWSNDLSGAIENARSSRRPVMIDFYMDWCGWCKKLDKETYSDAKVQGFAQGFICVKVNGEKFSNLVSKYLVEVYPTIVFLDPDGKEVSRIEGYAGPGEFLKTMEEVASKFPAPKPDESQQAKAADPGWKTAITDFWNKIKGRTTPEESIHPTVQVQEVPKAGTESSPASEKTVVYGDLILMKNGSSVQGIVKEEKSDAYLVKLPFGEVTLKKSDVKEIKRLLPEEACLNMGDRFLESHDFDRATEEYNKALRVNPDFKPANDAIAVLKQKKIEYDNKQKAIKEEIAGEEAKKNAGIEETSRPAANRFVYHLDTIDMNKGLSRSYTFADFGFTVDANLKVDGFIVPNSSPDPHVPKSVSISNPAQDAGIRAGDKVMSVNGKSTEGLNAFDAAKLIGSHRYIKVIVER